ncbi:c4ece41b-1fd3-4dd6-b6a1-209b63c0fdce-CDS [Sclerotinia trifoliorum]|uniref:C4ece41b-1fd3-4dd6-b6a1-209b63c0fdce-CDS n=1 Tax=Sclerotinia trifoliorum TaxID=28548 RepID=A0A8H2VSJ0_9HELO|nr:c4ece41b-1fd3-4dd6-b6a1-209b63c0fdce-CDS [Sclerotinia trifoliorum]
MGYLSDWKKGKSPHRYRESRRSEKKSDEATKSINQDSKVDNSKKDVKSATVNVGGHEDVNYHVNYDSDDENEALCLENTAIAGGGEDVSHHVNYDSDD